MDKPVMSVKEARKLLGKDATSLSDEEIEKLISDLEFIARQAIRSYHSKLSSRVE